MADKFACTHCGFVFEDPDMEVCPRCGTELGQEWDPAELRSFVITELTEEQAKFVATLTASSAEEIFVAFRSDGCFALENLTPRQVEAYAEFLKQEGIPFVAESEEQKAIRLQKQLEAHTASKNAEAEKAEQVRMEQEAKRNAEAAKAQSAAQARAEAETEKVRLTAIIAQAETEAKAKAQLELDKIRMEQDAAEKKNQAMIAEKAVQARRKMIYIWGSIVVVLLIGFFIFSSINNARKQTAAKNSALSDLQMLLRDDPFMTYETYAERNPGKLTLAEFDKVYQMETKRIAKVTEEARAKVLEELKILLRNDPVLSSSNPENMLSWTLPNGSKLEMVFCPAGSFTMGSPADEDGHHDDKYGYYNEIQHQVTLTKPFLIGKYEVTQAQYQAVMGKNPSYFLSPGRPVEQVNWHEAMAFCNRLNENTEGKRPKGYQFTLPTEAQWEYACRAGTSTSLNSGRNMRIIGEHNAPALDKVGWYGGNCGQDFQCSKYWDISCLKEKQYDNSRGGSHPVGKKMPNAWGIYDMHGNVTEWCRDWRNKNYGDDITDPTGPINGSSRVCRGGAWELSAVDCRSASRCSANPTDRYNTLGFRVVLSAVR